MLGSPFQPSLVDRVDVVPQLGADLIADQELGLAGPQSRAGRLQGELEEFGRPFRAEQIGELTPGRRGSRPAVCRASKISCSPPRDRKPRCP